MITLHVESADIVLAAEFNPRVLERIALELLGVNCPFGRAALGLQSDKTYAAYRPVSKFSAPSFIELRQNSGCALPARVSTQADPRNVPLVKETKP